MGAPGAVETEEQEINPPVKMRLERSAERDKREIINNLSAEYAQSERGAHSESSHIKRLLHKTLCSSLKYFTFTTDQMLNCTAQKAA